MNEVIRTIKFDILYVPKKLDVSGPIIVMTSFECSLCASTNYAYCDDNRHITVILYLFQYLGTHITRHKQ